MTTRKSLIACVLLLLVVSATPALALFRSSGPGCPGNIDDLITASQDGDVITLLYEEEFGRNSNSQLITHALTIEGGWVDPSNNFNCGGNADGVWATREALLAAGLQYEPAKHSGIVAFGDAVLKLDAALRSFTARNLDVMQDDTQASGNGAGLTVVGTTAAKLTGARVMLQNVTFRPNYFASEAGASGDGGAIYLDLDGGSELTLSDSRIQQYQAGGSGGGFYLIVRGDSKVLIERTVVEKNTATTCGGGKIIIHSGTVTLSASSFRGNTAGGQASDLCVERAAGATGVAKLYLLGTTFSNPDALKVTGNITVYTTRVMLPLLRQ